MSKKLLMLLTAMGTLSVTLIAAPIVKDVTAKLDPTITFNLNGEQVMKDSNALMYNDTLYLPVRAIGTELGAEINYKDKVVYIDTEETTMNEARTKGSESVEATETTPALEAVRIESATLKDIDADGTQLTILPAGKEDIAANMIILNLSEETTITVDGKEATLADLSLGMELSVSHSQMMTRSLPPQTPAFTVEAKTTTEGETLPESITLEDVQVVEVNKTNFGYQVTVGKNENPENPENQTILNVNDDTLIHHEKNKMIYKAEDLEKGMKVTVKHSPIMTLSLPGQTTAFEITILAQ
ncbi:stalk domain-containing protein [Niameybacter massiliensis]|uniref:stalk domain-containing protein n=1 Tax=Niameybacter massiliensis TaxID=1658108 RepID=UPI0006B564D0|nr:hypothetical protein [Niameybacter massiliensis]